MQTKHYLTFLAVLSLTGCGGGDGADAGPRDAAANDPFQSYNTTITVRDLMASLVDPNARRLWGAVSYVVTEKGVEEDVMPRGEEDWRQLRASALALIEAGNVLMLPGRRIAGAGAAARNPAIQHDPAEIKALIAADPEGWNYYIQSMQLATGASLESIEKRDVFGLTRTSAVINDACEGCHAEYWYRGMD